MSRTLILARANWPPALRLSWEAGIRPPVLPKDPTGAGGRWRHQTVQTTEASMGRYLRYASDQHWPLEQEPVVRLVTKARLQAYMAELFARNAPATVLHRIIGLERGMAVLAPKSNRALLRLVIADLEEHFDPVSKRERLQETAALVGLGFSLMADAEINQNKYRKRVAAQYRDGLMIAFLARRPIRLRNLSMMLIGQHVKPVGGFWRLRFERHEVKNNRPINLLFPEDLVEPLERYLKDYRPILAGRRFAGQALWVSGQEQQLCPISIRQQLCDRTKDAFNLPITPHLFRDCAATSLAVHAPEIVQIAHLILGNTYAVMEKHYNLARVVDAGRHLYDALGLD